MDLINIYDYEKEALKKLPKMVGDYYASGANDEITLQENHRAYDRLKLKYKVLRDISERDISSSILGQDISMPLIIAPTAFHKMAHPQGEIATAQGVGNMNTIMILSTLSTCSIEEVTQSTTSSIWFQLYIYRDREATRELVKKAEKAGCKAIVLTVDAQIWGHRERDTRNKFTLPKGLEVKNLDASGKGFFPDDSQGSGLSAYVHNLFDPSLN